MTSWINRSDEALMDTRKKTGDSANFLRINNDPSTKSRFAASAQGEIERSGHCWSHDHDRRQLVIVLAEKSLLDLFTDDVLQSLSWQGLWKYPKTARF